MLNVQHKTLPQTLPMKFYVFEDFTNPTIILSYAASSRLGIVQFTVPNKTPVNFPSRTNAITHNKTLTFSQHQKDTPQNSHNNRDSMPKPIIKQLHKTIHKQIYFNRTIFYLSKTINHQQPTFRTINCPYIMSHKTISPQKSVKRHNSLKNAFPNSFDTTGNMPVQYTIRVDPSIPPVQHAQRKGPTEAKEE